MSSPVLVRLSALIFMSEKLSFFTRSGMSRANPDPMDENPEDLDLEDPEYDLDPDDEYEDEEPDLENDPEYDLDDEYEEEEPDLDPLAENCDEENVDLDPVE